MNAPPEVAHELLRGRHADAVAHDVGRHRWLLTTIRAIHSAIFLVMLSAIPWLVATGITGRRDRSVVAAGVLVAIESGVFLANGGVSDIFLPDTLARTIPIWASALVVLGTVLHVRREVLARAVPTG
jgi:hypothetical protein